MLLRARNPTLKQRYFGSEAWRWRTHVRSITIAHKNNKKWRPRHSRSSISLIYAFVDWLSWMWLRRDWGWMRWRWLCLMSRYIDVWPLSISLMWFLNDLSRAVCGRWLFWRRARSRQAGKQVAGRQASP